MDTRSLASSEPQSALRTRVQREVEHGSTETAVRQAEFGWDSPAGRIRRERRFEFLAKDLSPDSEVLELGAGTGLQTLPLIKIFKSVTGIDISPDLLKVAETRAPGAKYLVMDAHKLEFPDNSFDAVLGVSILHHLDWEMSLRECFRVLRPGGVVRFSEPNLLNPQIYLQKNIPALKRLAGDSPDEYAFTKWQIESSLRKCGFERLNVRPFEFLHPATPENMIPFVTRLENIISSTPLNHIAGSLLIEARRVG